MLNRTKTALARIRIGDAMTVDAAILELYGRKMFVFDREKAEAALRQQGVRSVDREEALGMLEERANDLYN